VAERGWVFFMVLIYNQSLNSSHYVLCQSLRVFLVLHNGALKSLNLLFAQHVAKYVIGAGKTCGSKLSGPLSLRRFVGNAEVEVAPL